MRVTSLAIAAYEYAFALFSKPRSGLIELPLQLPGDATYCVAVLPWTLGIQETDVCYFSRAKTSKAFSETCVFPICSISVLLFALLRYAIYSKFAIYALRVLLISYTRSLSIITLTISNVSVRFQTHWNEKRRSWKILLGRILLPKVHANNLRTFLPFSACFQRYRYRRSLR